MSNTIKPMDNAMLTKLGDKPGSAKDAMSTSGAHRIESGERAAASTARNDTVALTSGARLLERLEKSLASLPDVDPGRVAAVKAAIASGDYVIDAEKIADALLRTDRQFGRGS